MTCYKSSFYKADLSRPPQPAHARYTHAGTAHVARTRPRHLRPHASHITISRLPRYAAEVSLNAKMER